MLKAFVMEIILFGTFSLRSQAGHINKRREKKRNVQDTIKSLRIHRVGRRFSFPVCNQQIAFKSRRSLIDVATQTGTGTCVCLFLFVCLFYLKKKTRWLEKGAVKCLHALSYYCCDVFTDLFTKRVKEEQCFPTSNLRHYLSVLVEDYL